MRRTFPQFDARTTFNRAFLLRAKSRHGREVHHVINVAAISGVGSVADEPLERSAAADAMIGMAHHPGGASPQPRHESIRHLVTMGDESGASSRRLPGVACHRGVSVACRKRCPRERDEHAGKSHHVASPLTAKVELVGLLCRSPGKRSMAREAYVTLNETATRKRGPGRREPGTLPESADEARDRRSWCLPLRRSCRGCAVRGSVFGTAIRHAPNGPAR